MAEAGKKDVIERVRDKEVEDEESQERASRASAAAANGGGAGGRRESIASLSDMHRDGDAEEELLRREMGTDCDAVNPVFGFTVLISILPCLWFPVSSIVLFSSSIIYLFFVMWFRKL
jgi:hypothetical protein